ncbi:hypothetical protein NDN08_005305 [Rhodosorus marinus]|uniref:MULE transposase domain-containing protein n=1 Tax=Rhodosorus marinus TaxID=101924 RepID=A0AAV8V174_9RHOD|nr:hypothetical protein NDN08_005305 [Rhodosorus marinus]
MTRPDIIFSVVTLANEFDARKVTKEHMQKLQSVTRKTTQSATSFRFSKLKMKNLRLVVFSDASFTSGAEPISHIGYLIFVMDHSNKASLISWRSHKAQAESIFYAVMKASVPQEKGLVVDLASIRESYGNGTIQEIGSFQASRILQTP